MQQNPVCVNKVGLARKHMAIGRSYEDHLAPFHSGSSEICPGAARTTKRYPTLGAQNDNGLLDLCHTVVLQRTRYSPIFHNVLSMARPRKHGLIGEKVLGP